MEELLPRNRVQDVLPMPRETWHFHAPLLWSPSHHPPDLSHLMASLPTAGNTWPLVTLPSPLPSSSPGSSGMPTEGTRKPGPAFKVLHGRTITNGQYSQNLPPLKRCILFAMYTRKHVRFHLKVSSGSTLVRSPSLVTLRDSIHHPPRSLQFGWWMHFPWRLRDGSLAKETHQPQSLQGPDIPSAVCTEYHKSSSAGSVVGSIWTCRGPGAEPCSLAAARGLRDSHKALQPRCPHHRQSHARELPAELETSQSAQPTQKDNSHLQLLSPETWPLGLKGWIWNLICEVIFKCV